MTVAVINAAFLAGCAMLRDLVYWVRERNRERDRERERSKEGESSLFNKVYIRSNAPIHLPWRSG